MAEAGRRLTGLVSLAVLSMTPATGLARIQEYQIVRLIIYKADCDVDRLELATPSGRERRYHVTCRNLTFYPDGIDVVCADPDDEQSCTIRTPPRSFDNLHALQPKD